MAVWILKIENKVQGILAKNFLESLKFQNDTGHFYSSNHQKWPHCQILGGKTVKNAQIDPQTT